MAFQPAAGERAVRHDRQALADGAVDGRGDQHAADAPALEFLGDLGVYEGQPFPTEVVAQFGKVATVGDLESGRGLVVCDRNGIAHPAILASGTRPAGPGCVCAAVSGRLPGPGRPCRPRRMWWPGRLRRVWRPVHGHAPILWMPLPRMGCPGLPGLVAEVPGLAGFRWLAAVIRGLLGQAGLLLGVVGGLL